MAEETLKYMADGQNKNAMLEVLEKRAREILFIKNNYSEEDREQLEESIQARKNWNSANNSSTRLLKSEADQVMDIGEINNSIVDHERDKENLIIDKISSVRKEICKEVDSKVWTKRGKAPPKRGEKRMTKIDSK